MDHFDMVEMLREKAQVSYQEAKESLEKSSWEMTEAMIWLEREGRLNQTAAEVKREERAPKNADKKPVRKHTESLGNIFPDFIT